VEDARAKLTSSVTSYELARERLAQVDSENDPRTRGKSTFVLAHDDARRRVVEAAQDLAEARSEVETAKQALTDALADHYSSGISEWRLEKHALAVKADEHLTALADLLSDLRQIHLQELTARDAAGVSGANVTRFDRVVASSMVRQLAGAAPALRDTLGFIPYRVRGLAALFEEAEQG
jgi:hypothetical protein